VPTPSVTLVVVDRMQPYALLDRAGRVVERRAGRGRTTWVVTLTRADGEWRVWDVHRSG
jgi:hypothetical protein